VKARGRLAFLDSLRGWAAVYVMLYHTALIPQPALHVPGWAASVVLTGGTGVTLFFVASAFSLCRAARPGESHGVPLAAYAVRRFFRIAPLFYVVLAATLLRDFRVFGVQHEPTTILANVTFLFNLWPGKEEGIAWASWTIGVEMLFYAIFPVLVARADTLSRAAVALLLTLLVAALYTALLHYLQLPPTLQSLQDRYGVVHHLPVFTAGLLAYRIFQRYIEPGAAPLAAGTALLLAAAYLYASLISGNLGSPPFHSGYYWQAVVYGAIVLGLAIHPNKLLVNPVTLYLGKISYSLYLLHPMIVFALIPFYRLVEARGWPSTISFGLCAAVTLTAVVACATITYAFIEAPGMRLGARITGRLDRSLAQQQIVTAIRK
jgi:peptidoglycan/LPS O-acetylase OafA/YrhL